LLASIGRLFDRPSATSGESPLGEFLDVTISRWNDLQKAGWLVDPKENRTALAFQYFTGDRKPIQPIGLSNLEHSIREASNAADAECDGLPTFDTYSSPKSPSVILIEDSEGYECESIYKDGSYLFAPSLWRALASGVGAEVRPYHEDTEWVRLAVEERSSRKWPVGTRLSPRFQASRMYGFVAFVRNLASTFTDAERVRLIADYNGLADRTIDDPRAGIYYSQGRKSVTTGRRVQIETTVENLLGDGASEAVIALLNHMLRLFDGWQVNRDFVRKSIKNF
jgi:hypothetical protein